MHERGEEEASLLPRKVVLKLKLVTAINLVNSVHYFTFVLHMNYWIFNIYHFINFTYVTNTLNKLLIYAFEYYETLLCTSLT